MLQTRPLPSLVRFPQILGQLVKLKHYWEAITLYKVQTNASLRISPDVYSLSIIMNCYSRLNRIGFSLSVLAQFFKFGLELNVTTFTTLIIGFFIQNKVAEAAAIFSKMVEAGIQPNVVTFGTLIKGLCIKGNNVAAIQLLRKMEQGHCKPNVVVYNTIIDSLFKDARTR
ncbi:putative pentatricopeptide [Rosa chinensis]|uniref:Putative pentatricopeptide n=1 Tax=Rosa chinensis TaxID=74649 RepID=A0A2P6QHU5_ROSCH|nr:putative pentatricopeptide [Rosa chinensis]